MKEKEKQITKKKSEQSCCIFSAMVPLVLVVFILYLGTYIGTLTGAASIKTENLTLSDALQLPPQLHFVGSIQAMAEALNQPNQFMPSSEGKYKPKYFFY